MEETKKHVVTVVQKEPLEAVQWDGENDHDVNEFLLGKTSQPGAKVFRNEEKGKRRLYIRGVRDVDGNIVYMLVGDWIVFNPIERTLRGYMPEEFKERFEIQKERNK